MTFNPGVLSQAVSVSVRADTAAEAGEELQVKLSSPSGGATLTDSTGVTTIRKDD